MAKPMCRMLDSQDSKGIKQGLWEAGVGQRQKKDEQEGEGVVGRGMASVPLLCRSGKWKQVRRASDRQTLESQEGSCSLLLMV